MDQHSSLAISNHFIIFKKAFNTENAPYFSVRADQMVVCDMSLESGNLGLSFHHFLISNLR